MRSNKIITFILLVFVFNSCKVKNLRDSGDMVKFIEMNKLANYNKEFGNQLKFKKELDFLNKQHNSFFEYRDKRINKFIIEKEFKKFTLVESIYNDDYSGVPMYLSYVITKDSIFKFAKNFYSENLSVEPYKPYIYDMFYIYKGDSVLVTRNIDFVNYEKSIQKVYISNFEKGILDQFSINDSVVFKSKHSKMIVDLNRVAWRREGGEFCIDDRRTGKVQCGDVRYGNCVRNEEGSIMHCDTLR